MRLILSLLALMSTAPFDLAGATTAQAEVVRVTTDSAAYCGELSQRLSVTPHAEAEPARSLAEEGRRLCDNGYVRTGVAKLRRALRAAMNQAN